MDGGKSVDAHSWSGFSSFVSYENAAPVLKLSTLLLLLATLAFAQGYVGDARKIGMGNPGHTENIAAALVQQEKLYGSSVLPFGLIQLATYWRKFNPGDDEFDPILMFESAANPLHLVFGRNPGGPRGRFLKNALEGELSRNLNTYRPFAPHPKLKLEALASHSWGKTAKIWQRDDGAFQGLFIGLGPYISASTQWEIDRELVNVLSSPAPVPSASLANKRYTILWGGNTQAALALTGGYRGRVMTASMAGKDGIYLAFNYHYLNGFRYENFAARVELETDATGALTDLPSAPPFVVNRLFSKRGSGYAVDVGTAVVLHNVEAGFGVSGIGNRIRWEKFGGRSYYMRSLVRGEDFNDISIPVPESLEVRLPVDYHLHGAYNGNAWTAVSEFARGFQGSRFHGGFEYRFGAIELRGGGAYFLERWHPTAGVSFRVGENKFLDLAVFPSTANIELEPRPAIAISIRTNKAQ